jgi:NAD+ synthase
MDDGTKDPFGVLERWHNEIADTRSRVVGSLKAEVAGRGFTRVALGLSGGLDSTVAAALCVEALGGDNVLGVLMPMRTTDSTALSLAQGVVNALGITSRRVNMSPVLDAYFANFPDANRDRRGRGLAWLRTGVLVDLGAHYGAAAVQVVNRSDRLLGYGEGLQEMLTAVKPLAGLYKSQVRLLGDLLEVLPEVRRRRPSLEYWPGQTDEGDLGFPYATVDPLLEALVERRLEPLAAPEQGFDRSAAEWAGKRVTHWRLETAAGPDGPRP